VIPDLRLCLFADGCFFHRCPKHWRLPATRTEYWQAKIARNVRRARRVDRDLRRDGWSVWHVWEHNLAGKTLAPTEQLINRRLARRELTLLGPASGARWGGLCQSLES
jgi:DNA mismatch endonuclease (patch repair protein)